MRSEREQLLAHRPGRAMAAGTGRGSSCVHTSTSSVQIGTCFWSSSTTQLHSVIHCAESVRVAGAL
eukprot:1497779-Pleurochrysis_carterae.AAC.2